MLCLTQVRPDLMVLVRDGPFGGGPHCLEYERYSVLPYHVASKLGPCRRMARAGRPLPLLMVCRAEQAEANLREVKEGLPMLATTQERAFAGPRHGVAAGRNPGRPALPVLTGAPGGDESGINHEK